MIKQIKDVPTNALGVQALKLRQKGVLLMLQAIVPPVETKEFLPNVAKFNITELAEMDKALQSRNINKRTHSPKYELCPYKQKQANRSIKFKFKHLNTLRTNPASFWSFADKHLLRNRTYQIINLNAVLPNWYKNQTLGKVKQILKALSCLDLNKYKSSFFHVPKANGELREIISPSPDWRIYLHGFSKVLELFLSLYTDPEPTGIPKLEVS